MAQAKALGLKVGSWTVNEPARAKELSALGVQCVITDTQVVWDALRPAAPKVASW
jgi:glycerophosphoryl diester phosphodiesterase